MSTETGYGNIFDIMDTLPHRYPFLLVDRITYIDGIKEIKGYKNVTFNEPFFQGHFPGEPVMPGVLIVEAMAQVGGMLLKRLVEDPSKKLILFMGMDNVRFRQIVIPGDRIEFEVKLVRPNLRAAKMEGLAFVNGKEVCRATMLASVVDRTHSTE